VTLDASQQSAIAAVRFAFRSHEVDLSKPVDNYREVPSDALPPHYSGRRDIATKEQLTEKNKKFEFEKVFQLPWTFWAILTFSLFQTSTAATFSQNATELAEQRFDIDSITAGWYSSLSQYAGTY
jgi:hypothetical protein